MKHLKIKICGLRDVQNTQELILHAPDFFGFIFYKKSIRYAGNNSDLATLNIIPESPNKTGVFVDSSIEYILKKTADYKLNYVQLHGNESENFCNELHTSGIKIIKAFSVSEDFDFTQIEKYKSYISYALFDTKSNIPGGSGKKFNWNILSGKKINVPFFISGGISIQDVNEIIALKKIHSNLYGVDINSRFEISPGIKDVKLVTQFIHELKTGEISAFNQRKTLAK